MSEQQARWTMEEMMQLAASGMHKVDLLGHRGATMVTCDEVTAMAAMLALHVPLPHLRKKET